MLNFFLTFHLLSILSSSPPIIVGLAVNLLSNSGKFRCLGCWKGKGPRRPEIVAQLPSLVLSSFLMYISHDFRAPGIYEVMGTYVCVSESHV